MPKTKTYTDEDIDAFIDSIDPTTMRDGKHLREIAAARESLADAEVRLEKAVAAAREAGDPWSAIALMLHTSKQNAYRKFGKTSDRVGS